MKTVWKPTLFVVLNALFFFISLAITLMHLDVYTGKQEDPLGLLGIIPADIAFVAIGLGLFAIGGYFHISTANKLLPFVAALGFLVALLFESEYARPKFLLGLSIGIVLCIAIVVTTVQTLMSSRTKRQGVNR
ncbi:MAG: hypothetical protein EXR67_06095 [Dehalococcoidia bacterium]|nr:hypothetical protein [Dehalococcoidia bacterium]